MSKLEEAAKAYWTANEGDNPSLYSWEQLAPKYREQKINHMRAAIAVLREPSEAMARAWAAAGDGWKDGYVAMIDATEDE